jgi:molybdopterin converting factor small subunit
VKVRVDFIGIPTVSKLVGSKSISVDFPDKTVGELIKHISKRYGKGVRDFLLDESGNLDLTFQILLNGTEWISRKDMNRNLSDDDVVRIILLAGGG